MRSPPNPAGCASRGHRCDLTRAAFVVQVELQSPRCSRLAAVAIQTVLRSQLDQRRCQASGRRALRRLTVASVPARAMSMHAIASINVKPSQRCRVHDNLANESRARSVLASKRCRLLASTLRARLFLSQRRIGLASMLSRPGILIWASQCFFRSNDDVHVLPGAAFAASARSSHLVRLGAPARVDVRPATDPSASCVSTARGADR